MRNVCYEREIPILCFVVAFMTALCRTTMPVYNFMPALLLLFFTLLFYTFSNKTRQAKTARMKERENFYL